jgi:hypothetical protein
MGYGTDDQKIMVRFPEEIRDFSLPHCIYEYNGCGATQPLV